MITSFCQTQSQVSDLNQLLQASGYGCQCQFTPPINEFTYCVLKKICKKILKEICQEQRKEVYTVFDGGRCSKYETLMKDTRPQPPPPPKNEKQSINTMLRPQRNRGKRFSIRGSVGSQTGKRGSLDKSDEKITTKKEENGRAKGKTQNGRQQGNGKIQNESEQGQSKKQKEKERDNEEEIEKNSDKEKENEITEKERRDEKSKLRVRKEKTDKSSLAGKEKAEKENADREKLEKESAARDKARSMKEIEKAQADFRVNPMDKRNRSNRRRSQGYCGKRKLGLLVDRLDIDRDFAKRQDMASCTQNERFEQICISQHPCRKLCRRPCALSRIDSIRPCDYMRAYMEYREMCCPRVLPPCEPCVFPADCFASNEHSRGPADPCGSYVQCMS